MHSLPYILQYYINHTLSPEYFNTILTMLLNTIDPVRVAAFAVVVALTAVLADYARMLWMRRRLPPGPFPFPIVGNHFQTPSNRPWITWEKWAQYYDSPMLTLWIGREPRIILSDAWVASDLLEKKSDIFSSRPRIVVMGDAINATTTNQTVLEYGNRWRDHRRLMVRTCPTKLLGSCKNANRSSMSLLGLRPFGIIGTSKPMNRKSWRETYWWIPTTLSSPLNGILSLSPQLSDGVDASTARTTMLLSKP